MPPLTMFGRTNWWPLLLAAISWPVPTELAATTSCSSENAIWRNTQARTPDKQEDRHTDDRVSVTLREGLSAAHPLQSRAH